jgi:hypothetical protein
MCFSCALCSLTLLHHTRLIKVKLSRDTPWRRLGWEEVQLLLILNLGTRWGECSTSRPGRALPPGKGPPVLIVQEAGWAPRDGRDAEAIEKILCLCRRSNPDRPVRSLSLLTELPRLIIPGWTGEITNSMEHRPSSGSWQSLSWWKTPHF